LTSVLLALFFTLSWVLTPESFLPFWFSFTFTAFHCYPFMYLITMNMIIVFVCTNFVVSLVINIDLLSGLICRYYCWWEIYRWTWLAQTLRPT
jgi:hypothetical protein